MINSAPQVMRLPIDPDEHFIQMPPPIRIRSMLYPSFPDLTGEHRTEPVPPKPNCFMANIDASFKQQVFDLPKGQRISNVHHHREAGHFG